MPTPSSAIDPSSMTTFGALLRYLRRRARLTQRDLGIAVGYSEGHINRLEKNTRTPDPSAVAALFIPALDLAHEPTLATRLMELAAAFTAAPARPEWTGEPIPPAPAHEITRTQTLALARVRLADENRLVLCGLPGIGKTTLASALAREYSGTLPVFWLTLTEGVTADAELWVRQLAAFLLAQGQDQVKPLVSADPRTRSEFSFQQQLTLLGTALAHQPAFLCFDNAEVIRQNQACLQLLQHLSAATPALLLITTRESLPLAKIAEMTIEGFDRLEALAFITQNSDHALNESQATRLVDKTGGNPMLLHLAMGQLREHRADPEMFIAHLETQPQVAHYLLQTFQTQSSPPAWRLLLLLAVFQQPLDLYDAYLIELVDTLGGIENIGGAIEELQRRHLIGDAATARLHPFVREYVYRTLNTQVNLRQRLHRLAGDWLKNAKLDAVATALHYARAGLPEHVLDVMEENQDAIIARGQALSAVAILDEVQTQIKRLPSTLNDSLRRLLVVRGTLLAGTLRASEGEANLREAIALTNNATVRANIVYRLAELAHQRSDLNQALRLAQTARADLAPDDLLLRARLASMESVVNAILGNFDESARAANEALALVDQMVGIPLALTGEIRARTRMELADIARQRRDLTTAMSHAQVALASARAAHMPRQLSLCLGYVGGLYYDLGDLDASFRYRAQALDELLALGDVHSAAYTLSYLADIHQQRLETDQALEKLERASETLRAVQDMRGLAAAEGTRTSCLLWMGRVREARTVIELLLKQAEGKGTERLWGYRLNKRAVVQLTQGETDAAIATLRQAHDLPPVSTYPLLHFQLHSTQALALAVAGDSDAAAQALADAPRFEGLSRWADLDRDLIQGYVALAQGDKDAACDRANQLLERTEEYPLYRQTANQLLAAIQQCVPVSAFPRWLWMRQALVTGTANLPKAT